VTRFNGLNKLLSYILCYLEHSQLHDKHVYLQERINEVYRKLKEVKEELRAFQQDNIRLHSQEKYISRKNENLHTEINNLKLQINEQDDSDANNESNLYIFLMNLIIV
jgi:hypothetical protein